MEFLLSLLTTAVMGFVGGYCVATLMNLYERHCKARKRHAPHYGPTDELLWKRFQDRR